MAMVVGIDPGKLGAIACLDGPGRAVVRKMPLLTSARGRDEYDLVGIVRLLQTSARGPCTAFVEQLDPLPPRVRRPDGSVLELGGSIGNYNRGAATWLFKGILTALGIPYQMVRPQAWMRVMHAGTSGRDTKQRSIVQAQRLFPDVSLLPTARSRKPSDGFADALLLAEYGRRQLGPGAESASPEIAAFPGSPELEEG